MVLHLGETQIPMEDCEEVVAHLPGLPRRCPKCETWSRYEKPKKANKCFSVECGFCGFKFEVIKGMKGARQL